MTKKPRHQNLHPVLRTANANAKSTKAAIWHSFCDIFPDNNFRPVRYLSDKTGSKWYENC